MRSVFHPPKSDTGWVRSVVLGIGLLGFVFGILPFTTAVSTSRQRQLMVTRVDVAAPPPVSEIADVPPPPPDEKEPEPEPPQLADAPEAPMNLSVSLDLAVGSGGVWGAGMPGDGNPSGAGNLDTFDMAELERRPEVISQVAPSYPSELRKAKVEGAVTLVFVLSETGAVEEPRIESASHPQFEKPALDAVRRWRFKPGLKDGQPVRTFMRLPMRFRLGNT